jgi:glycine/D-amino acid oxidase-like deaminating enzyme
MRVLIVGAGVIGTSIAYHLAARGAGVVVLERNAIACAASGKSGGFLAFDWCDGTPLMALARRSFALHAELAEVLEGDWGYRRMTTYVGRMGRSAALTLAAGPRWISPDVAIAGQIGYPTTTAQVNPAAFTAGMMRAAQARGAEVLLGEAEGLLRRDGDVVGVLFDGDALEADAVVIAMGSGRCWRRNGCRCPRCSASKVTASSSKPARQFRRKPCFSSMRSQTARSFHRRSSRAPMARPMCAASQAKLPLQ